MIKITDIGWSSPHEKDNTGYDAYFHIHGTSNTSLKGPIRSFLESIINEVRNDIGISTPSAHITIQASALSYDPTGSFVSDQPLCIHLVPRTSDVTEVANERDRQLAKLYKANPNISRDNDPVRSPPKKNKKRFIPLHVPQDDFKHTLLRDIAESHSVFLIGQIVQCEKKILGNKSRPALIDDITFGPDDGKPIYGLLGISSCQGKGIENNWMTSTLKGLCRKFRHDSVKTKNNAVLLELEGGDQLHEESFLNTDEIWYVKGTDLTLYHDRQYRLTPESFGTVINDHKRALATPAADKYTNGWLPSKSTNGTPGVSMNPWLAAPSLTTNQSTRSPPGAFMVLALYMKEQQKLKYWVKTPTTNAVGKNLQTKL